MPAMICWRLLPMALLLSCSPAPGGGGNATQPTQDVVGPGAEGVITPPSCTGTSSSGLAGCVEMTRYVADLEVVAKARPPGSVHWQAVQDLCADRFAAQGFAVERHAYGSGTNVIGVLAGTTSPDEHVIVSAHYDSVADCAGADDNATGVAGVLEAARVLSTTAHPRTLVVACWDEEESGLVGSRAYADRANERGEKIVMAYVFEMIGYRVSEPNTQTFPFGFDLIFPALASKLDAQQNRGDFIALVTGDNAPAANTAFATHADALGLRYETVPLNAAQRTDPLFGQLNARSDHAGFWKHGYPAMMITDTSEFRYAHYHCTDGAAILDVIDDQWPVKEDIMAHLDHDFAARVVAATVGSAADILAGP